MAVGDITKKAIDGTALSVTLTTKYTVTANNVLLRGGLTFCNFDAAARQIEVRVIESGGSSGTQHRMIKQSSITAIQPGETQRYTLDVMEAGDKVDIAIDSGTSVTVRGFAVEQQVT